MPWIIHRLTWAKLLAIALSRQAKYFSQFRSQMAQLSRQQMDITWLCKTWIIIQIVVSYRAGKPDQVNQTKWIVDLRFTTRRPLRTTSRISWANPTPWANKIQTRICLLACKTRTSTFKMHLRGQIRHISPAIPLTRITWSLVDNPTKWYKPLMESSFFRIQMHRCTIRTIAAVLPLTPSSAQASPTFQCTFPERASQGRPQQPTSLVITLCPTRASKVLHCQSSHNSICQGRRPVVAPQVKCRS